MKRADPFTVEPVLLMLLAVVLGIIVYLLWR